MKFEDVLDIANNNAGLRLEDVGFLYCLYTYNKQLLKRMLDTGTIRITREKIDYLIMTDFIQLKHTSEEGKQKDYRVNNIIVTEKTNKLFEELFSRNTDISIDTSPQTLNEYWDEFLEVYPKKESNSSRYLHNLKSKMKPRYLEYITNPKSKYSHQDIIKVTKAYVDFKERRDEIFKRTKDRSYWIEAYPLLSTYVNNIEDKIDQYLELLESDKVEGFKLNLL